jgi:hypothetical protein
MVKRFSAIELFIKNNVASLKPTHKAAIAMFGVLQIVLGVGGLFAAYHALAALFHAA